MKKLSSISAGGGMVVACMLLATACGGGDGGYAKATPGVRDVGAPTGAAPTGSPTLPAGSPAASGGSGGQLAVRQDTQLGSLVTDGQGMTLYRFDKDTANGTSSNCDGDCAKTWPPVPADGAVASAGISSSALGQVKRADGTNQLTLGGWPVYRYAKDTAAGQTNGQGVQGTWNAIAPDGKKAKDAKGASRMEDMMRSRMPQGGGGKAGGAGGGRGGGQEGRRERKGTAELAVVFVPVVGNVIVDGRGRSLYLNSAGSGWRCDASCRRSWQPARPVNQARIRGIDVRLVGSVRLADGSRQLTIGRHPVYWYKGDLRVGETGGQGRDGCWAISPQGRSTRPTAPGK